MKKYKYKVRKFSGVTILKKDAELIRQIAQERGLPVYQITSEILNDWVNWKEPEKILDTICTKVYNIKN